MAEALLPVKACESIEDIPELTHLLWAQSLLRSRTLIRSSIKILCFAKKI